jgi:predicted Holliday junction resolvase-like endonuclease
MIKEVKIERLQQEIKDLKKQLDTALQSNNFISRIQELQQEKVYAVKIKDKKEAEQFIQMIEHAKRNIPWTLPQFVLISKPIEELETEKLKKILEMGKQ